jgi:hypothetical protein
LQGVAVILALTIVQGALHADPPEKEPTTPPTLAEEKERLRTLKEAEFRKLKAVVSGDTEYEKKLEALRNIAALATPEAVDLLSTLYDNPLKEDSETEQALLVELLGKTGSPAAGPTLLKAVQHPGKDGKVRLAAAGAIVRVMGKDAAAHLKKLTEDKVEAVKNRAWTELLKMQDLNAMRHVFKMLEGKEKLTALAMIKEAHFTEAAKEVAEIARETDFSKGPNEKILKLKALETALDLGHKESAAVAIELISAITEEQAKVLEVNSPADLLKRYTLEEHGTDKKKWQEWWDKKGKSQPLSSSYVSSTDLDGIGAGVAKNLKMASTHGPKLRPVINAVWYLVKSPAAERVAAHSNRVRTYTRSELILLDVLYWKVNVIQNGNKASVRFISSDFSFLFKLSKDGNKWDVGAVALFKNK